MSADEKVVLAIRLRGQVRVRPQIEDTLDLLKLGRLHQARILSLTPSVAGMVTKADVSFNLFTSLHSRLKSIDSEGIT